MSEGPDVDIRDLKYKGFSKFSGEFYIEDVQCKANGHTTRRLIFQNINPVIQTEIILKSGNYIYIYTKAIFFNQIEQNKRKLKKRLLQQTCENRLILSVVDRPENFIIYLLLFIYITLVRERDGDKPLTRANIWKHRKRGK